MSSSLCNLSAGEPGFVFRMPILRECWWFVAGQFYRIDCLADMTAQEFFWASMDALPSLEKEPPEFILYVSVEGRRLVEVFKPNKQPVHPYIDIEAYEERNEQTWKDVKDCYVAHRIITNPCGEIPL